MFSPHVHFPSTPGLRCIGNTHSPGTYDRTSIVPEKNSCAMPERGGRVYTPASVHPISGYFHPRAYEACELVPTAVPALLPDLSSETDESAEECISPKSASPEPHVAVHMQGTRYPTPMPLRRTHSQEEFDRALSFLPHPQVPIPRRDPGKQRSLHKSRRSVAFMSAECEGCLGGF